MTVDALTGVLFHVRAADAHVPRAARQIDVQVTVLGEGLLVLRDLIALREIRIEVLLAREDARARGSCTRARAPRARRAGRPARWSPAAPPASPRQVGAHVRVRLAPERSGATAEQLALREQLRVDFESNDRLVALTHCNGTFSGALALRSRGIEQEDGKVRRGIFGWVDLWSPASTQKTFLPFFLPVNLSGSGSGADQWDLVRSTPGWVGSPGSWRGFCDCWLPSRPAKLISRSFSKMNWSRES